MAKQRKSEKWLQIVNQIQSCSKIPSNTKEIAITEIKRMAKLGTSVFNFSYSAEFLSGLFMYRESPLGADFWFEIENCLSQERRG